MYLKRDSLNPKYKEFQILVKNFFGNFCTENHICSLNSLNYSMIVLGTDQSLDLLKLSQHQNAEKFWIFV